MNINYKNLFYIFHPDGKFTEDQLKKILDAAYAEGHKKGYNEGYEAGKNSTFHIGYPYTDWWNHPYYKITCNGTGTGDAATITPMSITTSSNPPSTTTTATTCTNKGNCNSCSNINCTPTKSESPYGMEFRYNGTEK